MLAVDGLEVYLGRSHVLQGLSFQAAADRVTALLGRNGVGKTTTLRTIMGLVRPSRGRVLWAGAELHALAPHRVVHLGLGWVPEHRGNFRPLTVDENLKVAYGGPRGHWRSRRDYVFDLFPILRDRQTQVAGSLSGGEQQMLAIAKALVTPRRFLLLDEPTQGLSPRIVDVLLSTLRTLRQDGMGLLLVEQNLEAALAVSDWVLVMEKGAIKLSVASGDLELDALVDLMGARRRPTARPPA